MKNAVLLGFALVLVFAVLVDSKPQAPKATVQKAPAPKAAATKPGAPKPAAPKPAAPKPAAPKADAPAATSEVAAFLKKPEVADLVTKVKGGYKPTSADIVSLAFEKMKSGAKTSNPSLNAVSAALSETVTAMKASPNGALPTGESMTYTNKIVNALGDATGTSKDNLAQLKTCVEKSSNSGAFGEKALQQAIASCSQFLGNGTKESQARVMEIMSEYLPVEVRGLLKGVDVQGLMSAVIANQAAGKGAMNMAGLKDAFALNPQLAGLSDIFNRNFGR